MNTDNCSVTGDTIDYGPCAFLDAYDPATVFSSIDRGGRYAYANQPRLAQWNLANLAQCLLPLIDADGERAIPPAQAAVDAFEARFEDAWTARFAAKLGLVDVRDGDAALARDFLDVMAEGHADFTLAFSPPRGRSGGGGARAVRAARRVRRLARALARARRRRPAPERRAGDGDASDEPRDHPAQSPRRADDRGGRDRRFRTARGAVDGVGRSVLGRRRRVAARATARADRARHGHVLRHLSARHHETVASIDVMEHQG